MDTITIRQATANDLDKLLLFEKGVIEAERPFDPTLKSGAIHYYDLKGMLTDPNVHIAVAEHQGDLIASGYARIKKAKTYLKHEQYAYLGFMYVRPEYRGRGINAQVVDALKKWALVKGINEMRLEVYVQNERATKAYEKIGFNKHMLEMRMDITPSPHEQINHQLS